MLYFQCLTGILKLQATPYFFAPHQGLFSPFETATANPAINSKYSFARKSEVKLQFGSEKR